MNTCTRSLLLTTRLALSFPAARNKLRKRSWADSVGRVSACFVSYTPSPPRCSNCIESLTQDAEEEEGSQGKALEPTSICLSEPDTSLSPFHSSLVFLYFKPCPFPVLFHFPFSHSLTLSGSFYAFHSLHSLFLFLSSSGIGENTQHQIPTYISHALDCDILVYRSLSGPREANSMQAGGHEKTKLN